MRSLVMKSWLMLFLGAAALQAAAGEDDLSWSLQDTCRAEAENQENFWKNTPLTVNSSNRRTIKTL